MVSILEVSCAGMYLPETVMTAADILGHMGDIGEKDEIFSMIEGERTGALKQGDLMVILGARIGHVVRPDTPRRGTE